MPSKKGSLPYLAKQARARAKRTEKYFNMIIDNKTLPKNQRAAAKSANEQIRKAVLATYTGRKPLTSKQLQSISENVAKLDNLVESAKMTRGKQGAANFFFQSQLNLASRVYKGADAALEAASNPSMLSREQVKVFYRATQTVWQNTDGTPTPTSEINKRIMRYFKTTSLETAFRRVLDNHNVKYALDIAEGRVNPNAQLTEEQSRFYERAESLDNEQDAQRSPDYLTYVVQFDPNRKWSEQVE